ncbi:MAG TPA: hypothetical protein VF604_10220 [Pyrinomonadaceae bacterium]
METDAVDRLISLEQWNNVRFFYLYDGTPENPQLILNFELQISAYQPAAEFFETDAQAAEDDIPIWRQNAINDRKLFADIYSQLNRNRDEQSASEPPEKAVSMFLNDTLLTGGKTSLASKDAQSLRDFVAACLAYVTDRSEQKDGGATPVCQLRIPISLNDISASHVIKLSLTLVFESHGGKDEASPAVAETVSITEPSKEKTAEINCAVESSIIPPQQSIEIFANAFESVFFNEDWHLRVGTSSIGSSQSNRKPIVTLWALRIGRKPNIGFYYEIQNQATFYAPKPVSDVPVTATFSISRYSTGNSFPGEKAAMTFSDVDLNQWTNTALAAIDAFLSISCDAFDSPLPDNPETDGCLAKIRRHKKTLAGAIAKTLVPIFSGGAGASDEISQSAAQEKFYQSLLERLSNAFISSAVTVFGVSNVSVDPPQSEDISPSRFYGQLQKFDADLSKLETVDSTAVEPQQNYSLTAGKVQYFKSKDGKSGDWRLPFLFSAENVGQQSLLSFPLAYLLTHLESDIARLPGIPKNEQNTWIQLVNAPLLKPIGANDIEFPVILRQLPVPPILTTQAADANVESIDAGASALAPSELTLWDYSFKYRSENNAQDYAAAAVAFNRQNSLTLPFAAGHPMFAPLAQFVAVYNEISTDYETAVSKINASSKPDETDVTNANAALDAFEQIVAAVAAAHIQWVNSPSQRPPAGEPPVSANYAFDIVLKSDLDGKARIDVINPEISEPLPEFPPLVEIESYIPKPAPDKPDNALVSYNYVLSEPPPPLAAAGESGQAVYLSYADALNIIDRTVVLKGLNAFTMQNAVGQIQIIRNGNTGTSETAAISDLFKFLTPQISFTDSIAPSLNYTNFDLGALQGNSPTLKNYLNAFFTALLKDAAGIAIWLKMTVSFSCAVSPSLPDSPRTILPVALLPPEQVIPQNGAALPVISGLANMIIDWTRANQPVLDSSSEYNIRLEIFGAASDEQASQTPLLSIDNLFINTEKIIFE